MTSSQCGLVILVLILLFAASASAANFEYFPKLSKPDKLHVIRQQDMSSAELLAVTTLQGALAQKKPRIYITANESYDTWLSDLKNEGTQTITITNPLSLFRTFAGELPSRRYILTQMGTPSVNAATTMAGLLGIPVIDQSLKLKVEALGYTMALDARKLTPEQVFKENKSKLNSKLLFRQDPTKPHLRDYIIATKGFVLYDEPVKFLQEVMAWVEDDSPLIGWGPGGEDTHVGLGAKNGLFTTPADWALNLSTLAAYRKGNLIQNSKVKVQSSTENVQEHYVTFIMTDGDNIQWLLGGMYHDSHWYGSPYRGSFPMTWTISPALRDLAPTVMERYYKDAMQDTFVAGVSGVGYMYPKTNPAIQQHVQRLSEYMDQTGLDIACVMDQSTVRSRDLQKSLELYSSIPCLKGGIYVDYRDYAGDKGAIVWSGGKPFVTARFRLWESDPDQLAAQINKLPKDPKSSRSYSLVWVHAWSHDLSDVARVCELLDSGVKVVSIEEFMNKVISNLKPSE